MIIDMIIDMIMNWAGILVGIAIVCFQLAIVFIFMIVAGVLFIFGFIIASIMFYILDSLYKLLKPLKRFTKK